MGTLRPWSIQVLAQPKCKPCAPQQVVAEPQLPYLYNGGNNCPCTLGCCVKSIGLYKKAHSFPARMGHLCEPLIITIINRGDIVFLGSCTKEVAKLRFHPGFSDPRAQLLPGPGVTLSHALQEPWVAGAFLERSRAPCGRGLPRAASCHAARTGRGQGSGPDGDF